MHISDYNQIIALWQCCDGISLRDADSHSGVEKYLERNPSLSFVAETESKIVGTLMAGHDGKRGYIQHLAVANQHRQQGIGSQLVDLCLDGLRQQGIVKSHVQVLDDNRQGRNFWVHRGWIHRNEIEMYSFINGGKKDS